MTTEITWIARRFFEASLAAVEIVFSENGSSSSKATRTLLYSTSSTPSGSGSTTLWVCKGERPWERR